MTLLNMPINVCVCVCFHAHLIRAKQNGTKKHNRSAVSLPDSLQVATWRLLSSTCECIWINTLTSIYMVNGKLMAQAHNGHKAEV